MEIKNQAEKIVEIYSSKLRLNEFRIGEIICKQFNYEFTVQDGLFNNKLKIQVYFGRKGIKTVIQGNKESEFYKEIENIISDQKKLDFKENDEIDFENYIGSDETGKGDIFGPLIICAFYYEKNMGEKLFSWDVRDSKEYSSYQIKQTAKKLISEFPSNFEVVQVSPLKYNELYAKFNNLNKLLNWGHEKAIGNLLAKFECKNIIIDKFSNQQITLKNFSGPLSNIIQTQKAERFAGVAAASIIARYYFDNWFSNNKNFKLLKGASQETAELAQNIFDNNGINELKKNAKLHFKSVKKFL